VLALDPFSPQVGDVIKVGGPLVDIQVADAIADESAAAAAAAARNAAASLEGEEAATDQRAALGASTASGAPPPPPSPLPFDHGLSAPGEMKATPAVRALAREMRVDMADVASTGVDNRILREDVLQFAQVRGWGGMPGMRGTRASTPASATMQACCAAPFPP